MTDSGVWWTKAWNPVTGCTPASKGCEHCFAATLHNKRHAAWLDGWRDAPECYRKHFFEIQLFPERLQQPLRWRKPQDVFVCNMGDLFHADVPDEFIDRMFAVMALAPQHRFYVLTKRAARMLHFLSDDAARVDGIARGWVDLVGPTMGTHETNMRWARANHISVRERERRNSIRAACYRNSYITQRFRPLSNVLLGATIENQARANERLPHLMTRAALGWKTFVSVEPMLGPVDLASAADVTYWDDPSAGLKWVVCGGESGPGARPMDPAWARSLRDQCQAAGIPFWFKQMSGRAEIPADLRVREKP